MAEYPFAMKGMKHLCELPKGLGNVVDLKVQAGKVVAETEAGVPFIVPYVKDG